MKLRTSKKGSVMQIPECQKIPDGKDWATMPTDVLEYDGILLCWEVIYPTWAMNILKHLGPKRSIKGNKLEQIARDLRADHFMLNAATKRIQTAERGLGAVNALIGGKSKPFCRLRVILGDSLSAPINKAQVILGDSNTVFGRTQEFFPGCLVIAPANGILSFIDIGHSLAGQKQQPNS